MCNNLRYIFTRSRVLSLQHRERLIVPCKCGVCAECRNQIRNEWYYRIYHEWIDCIDNNGYVFFDTLTYSNINLPHISEFVDIDIPKELDYSCFSYEDIRYFFVRLRRYLSYHGFNIANCLRYFLVAEYGTCDEYTDDRGYIRKGSHRPHYHVLFFVTDPSLQVCVLRKAINDSWNLGRTDRVRYYGKHSNYFTGKNNNDTTNRNVSSYVAKYVQKISSFQASIDYRLSSLMKYIFQSRFEYPYSFNVETNFDFVPDFDNRSYVGPLYRVKGFSTRFDYEAYESFLKSAYGKKYISDLKRLVNQFHRQSKGFGLSALRDVDLNHLFNTGYLVMPDDLNSVRKIPLPLYYERKLFYDFVKFENGYRTWELNSFGKLYKARKMFRIQKFLSDKFRLLSHQYHIHEDVDFDNLSRYCVYFRGRNRSIYANDVTFSEKLSFPDIVFNYSCPTDLSIFHEGLISYQFNGFCDNYYSDVLDNSIPIRIFLRDHLIRSDDYECFKGYDKILNDFDIARHNDIVSLNASADLRFELDDIYHNQYEFSFVS